MTDTNDNTHDVIPPHALAPWHAIRKTFATGASPAFLPAYDAALAHAWEAGEDVEDFFGTCTRFDIGDELAPVLVFGSPAKGWMRSYDAAGRIIGDTPDCLSGTAEKARRWNDESAALFDLIEANDWDDEMIARSSDRVNGLNRRILDLKTADPAVALIKIAAGLRTHWVPDGSADRLLLSLQETIKHMIAREAF